MDDNEKPVRILPTSDEVHAIKSEPTEPTPDELKSESPTTLKDHNLWPRDRK